MGDICQIPRNSDKQRILYRSSNIAKKADIYDIPSKSFSNQLSWSYMGNLKAFFCRACGF